uniref:Putative secreted protein n=1 Tax=Anopheles marajoara TaxID=58244 RepID=A0A2M4CA97_9DIPT
MFLILIYPSVQTLYSFASPIRSPHSRVAEVAGTIEFEFGSADSLGSMSLLFSSSVLDRSCVCLFLQYAPSHGLVPAGPVDFSSRFVSKN